MNAHIVFPNQLFDKEILNDIKSTHTLLLIEDPLFFSDATRSLTMSKLKLTFHRASMKMYRDELSFSGFRVEYYPFEVNYKSIYSKIKLKYRKLSVIDTVDKTLNARLLNYFPSLVFFDTPQFIFLQEDLESFRKSKEENFEEFYKFFRERTGVLMDGCEPVGGSFIYEISSRPTFKKVPKAENTFKISSREETYITEAEAYVNKTFPYQPGSGKLNFPICRNSSLELLNSFLLERLDNFGLYLDAFCSVETGDNTLYHSLLSSSLNSGLLLPGEVIEAVLDRGCKVLNSVEGFIRKVLGVREYMRYTYIYESETLRESNLFFSRNNLPKNFYTSLPIGIKPIDDCIYLASNTGYLHNVQRSMVIHNFMTLIEVNPDQIYRWFLDFFLDSYDWVLVPNCYVKDKPHISASNFFIKASNYEKDGVWDTLWDALYYKFLKKNLEYLKENERMPGYLLVKSEEGERPTPLEEELISKFLQDHTT